MMNFMMDLWLMIKRGNKKKQKGEMHKLTIEMHKLTINN